MVDPGRVRALLGRLRERTTRLRRYERVHAYLTERLGDLDRFVEAVLRAFPEVG